MPVWSSFSQSPVLGDARRCLFGVSPHPWPLGYTWAPIKGFNYLQTRSGVLGRGGIWTTSCRASQDKRLGSTDLAYSRVLIFFILEFHFFLLHRCHVFIWMYLYTSQTFLFILFVFSSFLSYTPCLLLPRRARVLTLSFLYLNVEFWHLKRGNVWLFSQCIFVQKYIKGGVNRCIIAVWIS